VLGQATEELGLVVLVLTAPGLIDAAATPKLKREWIQKGKSLVVGRI
jgi:hypothetical protein